MSLARMASRSCDLRSHMGPLLRRTLSLRTLSSAPILLKFKTVLERGPPTFNFAQSPHNSTVGPAPCHAIYRGLANTAPRNDALSLGGVLPTSSYSSPIVPIYQNVVTRPPPTEEPRGAAITFFLNVDWGRKEKTLQCWESGPPTPYYLH